jgi:signal transduction histidine kinase
VRWAHHRSTATRHALLRSSLSVALAFTVVVLTVPSVRFAYENLSLHVALETAEGLVAILVAALCGGRFRRTGHDADLLLTISFSLLAATNVLLSALPAIAASDRPGDLVTWLALVVRLEAAAGLLAAALLPDGRRAAGSAGRRVTVAAVAAVALAAVLATAAAGLLAEPIDPSLSPERSRRPIFTGHPVALATLAASLLCHVGAAVGFRRRATERGDEFLHWLAAGAAVAAVARVHYLLYPSLYSDWVYTGDLLRFSSYGLFLAGATGELVAHWRAAAQLAAEEQRRQLARELHDGLVQELSFIRSQTAGRAAVDGDLLGHIAAAAERGLTESRLALDLLDTTESRLVDALRSSAAGVSDRAGAQVRVHAAVTPDVAFDVRHALVRVVREAATNAVRHGGARTVDIDVRAVDGGVRVEVRDDGAGFDPAVATPGFGLRSMRERVDRLGGDLDVRSAPGEGTTVAATVPLDGR